MSVLRALTAVCVLGSLICCAGCSGRESLRENFTGLSGKVAPEAELEYSKARVLWLRKPEVPAGLETCSDPRQALALLDAALAREPEYADAYMRRGLLNSELGEHDAAFDDLSAAIRLSPRPDTYAYRGLVSLRGGNDAGARKDLERAIALDDAPYLAWNIFGVLEFLNDNKDAACDSYDKACSRGDCVALEQARKERFCP